MDAAWCAGWWRGACPRKNLRFDVDGAPGGSDENGARGISLTLASRQNMQRLTASPPATLLHGCDFSTRIKRVHCDGCVAEYLVLALQIAECLPTREQRAQ